MFYACHKQNASMYGYMCVHYKRPMGSICPIRPIHPILPILPILPTNQRHRIIQVEEMTL